jgi:hypothetical protein
MTANDTTFKAIETLFKQYGSGPDLYGAIKNLSEASTPARTAEQRALAAADASINILKIADALGAMFAAMPNALGLTANIGSFASNLNKARSRMANQGRLEVSDVSALVSDLAAFASSGMFLAASVNPALIPVAGALVLFGAAATLYGNAMDYRADNEKQLFIAEFGTQKLEAMSAYGDYSWGSSAPAFNENYINNPVMAPALQVIHAIDKNLPLDAAVELIGRAGIGGWLNGGKQKEASELLRVINKTLGGSDLVPATATDLETYATQLKKVWPLIQANAEQFRFITPGELASSNSAKTEFGVFLALIQLNPVAMIPTGSKGADALQAAHPSLYADWNADKNARLYGDTSKQPAYSDNWYTDRAAMLQALVTRNEKDIGGIVPGSQNLLYQDVASNTEVLVGAGTASATVQRLAGQKYEQKMPLVQGWIGLIAMNSQNPPRTTCHSTKTRAMKRMQTCASGIFDQTTNATRLGGMGRLV